MIIFAILLLPLLWAGLALVLAFPAGLFLMLLLTELHQWVPVIPEMPYWTAYAVSLFLAAFLSFLRPNITSAKND